MKATERLHDLGQSVWLDNITRDLLHNGTLQRYIHEFSVSGLTSNPTIFNHAIRNSTIYDDDIKRKTKEGSAEDVFFALAVADLTRAADMFHPAYEATNGIDGWVSIEVSPELAYDAKATLSQVQQLHALAARPNLLVKIPGTRQGLTAIEEAIFAGMPINVTLLFSAEQYLASAEAYMRGIERRIKAGLNPAVTSVASVFISRWDKATLGKVPQDLSNTLGIAVAQRAYRAYHDVLISDRMQRLLNFGARPQRLLWGSTGTKDPRASDTLYIEALAAPFTINTIPDATLKAFAEHGQVNGMMSTDTHDAERVIARFAAHGFNYDDWAARLQREGADEFVASWNEMLEVIKTRSAALQPT